MMTSALRASVAYVPEVSTSMYTALAWLRGSVHPAASAASSKADNESSLLVMVASGLQDLAARPTPSGRASASPPRAAFTQRSMINGTTMTTS